MPQSQMQPVHLLLLVTSGTGACCDTPCALRLASNVHPSLSNWHAGGKCQEAPGRADQHAGQAAQRARHAELHQQAAGQGARLWCGSSPLLQQLASCLRLSRCIGLIGDWSGLSSICCVTAAMAKSCLAGSCNERCYAAICCCWGASSTSDCPQDAGLMLTCIILLCRLRPWQAGAEAHAEPQLHRVLAEAGALPPDVAAILVHV